MSLLMFCLSTSLNCALPASASCTPCASALALILSTGTPLLRSWSPMETPRL
jgi:hypothetical protein